MPNEVKMDKKIYKIVTISSGVVTEGIYPEPHILSSGTEIPVIKIGEEGRGSALSFIVIEGDVSKKAPIFAVELSATKAGAPKFIPTPPALTNQSKIIVCFFTKIGFRGGNSHTGDRTPEWNETDGGFLPFPGEILVQGTISQGAAGRMGSGTQYIAIMPPGVVFRTAYSGRLYGAPASHYYKIIDRNVLVATWTERVATDIF